MESCWSPVDIKMTNLEQTIKPLSNETPHGSDQDDNYRTRLDRPVPKHDKYGEKLDKK